ncbi:TolC family protein [uncultured Alistipes sp.]|uniref:TolC family protein n=1 Tax=uncultured Alistipes sp. TaxID=538949 RepID=UPI0025E25B8D|nr:TolC family protein [uncultured Alistipes sp.]
MKKLFFIQLLLCLWAGTAQAQDTLRLDLTQAIGIGVGRSVDAAAAKNEYISAYWGYRTYRTELLPEITLNTTLPEYSKSYNMYQNTDGSYTYVSNNFTRLDAGLTISQNIPLTGGKVTVESSLERLRQNGANAATRYRTMPAAITLEQPLFGFNRVKWLKRIEPVKYEEARKKLVSDSEDVALTVIEYYFNLLLGQVNLEIAQQNYQNAGKLYTIAEARRKIGQLSEIELLQMRTSLLNAESALTSARSSLNYRMFQLRSFLGYGEEVVLEPSIPGFLTEQIPYLAYDQVLAMALQNNAFTHNVQRRMLEASRDVSQAKADRWDMKLYVLFGVSGQANSFKRAFDSHDWRDQQTITVGLSIPILDWGKRKGRVRVAKANKEVELSHLEKQSLDFKQNIFMQVQYFNDQPGQLAIAKKTDEIARQRYETSVEAFVLGKMDILNLNDSQSAKDEARRNYIDQMFRLWSYYYQIRSLTLYDFIADQPLEYEYPEE